MHLPEKDTIVFLEDEKGDEYTVNYISERTALSGGWKYFCANHQLAEGDVLIFNLVKPLRFKVSYSFMLQCTYSFHYFCFSGL